MNSKTSKTSKTQLLPTSWRQSYGTFAPEPRRRYPRDTASLAVTTRIAVVA